MKPTAALLFAVLMVFSASASAQVAEIVFSKSTKATDKATEFRSGDFIYAHLRFKKPISESLAIGSTYLTFTTEMYAGTRMLGEEFSSGHDPAKVRASNETTYIIPIVSNPAVEMMNFGTKKFAFELPLGLAKLSPGTHDIEIKVKTAAYNDGNGYLATGRFKLTTDAGSQAWYQKNEKDAREAQLRRGSSARIIAPSTTTSSIITLVNNCGRSVWLRYALGSDKREYRLGAGQTMRYDSDRGYLEEWNFGTKRWTTVSTMFQTDGSGRANICKK